jgi:hypothetical protein
MSRRVEAIFEKNCPSFSRKRNLESKTEPPGRLEPDSLDLGELITASWIAEGSGRP